MPREPFSNNSSTYQCVHCCLPTYPTTSSVLILKLFQVSRRHSRLRRHDAHTPCTGPTGPRKRIAGHRPEAVIAVHAVPADAAAGACCGAGGKGGQRTWAMAFSSLKG